ncbi:MAG: glycosyltransferase family 4 protein [Chloroflexi bacterium]|nr:glycosyltransferase family 4 protein [Chloroflexota bacterium]
MRILLANYRYFVSGGPERYMFNVTDALTARGHTLIPFSINYTRNQPTPYTRYFVEPLGSRDEIYFRDQRPTFQTYSRTLTRLFYAPDVERAITRLVAETKPQVAYVLHYLRKLSPSLLVGLKKAGLPIVVRLSDYAMLCPQAHCLRDNTPCELCVRGNLLPSIRYRCVQHSFAASALNALATWFHQSRRYFDLIDVFVTTTEFMYRMMRQAGFPERRLRFIPTFVNGNLFHPTPNFVKENYIAYAGRLEEIKGAHILIQALARLRRTHPDLTINLKIAGTGDADYRARLETQIVKAGLSDSIQFVGELQTQDLTNFLNRAILTIVPSVCYENFPNIALESYACGTPVLASRIGSLTECVSEGETGFLFDIGNAARLADRIVFCLDHPELLATMTSNARRAAETIYSPDTHLIKLEQLFGSLISFE